MQSFSGSVFKLAIRKAFHFTAAKFCALGKTSLIVFVISIIATFEPCAALQPLTQIVTYHISALNSNRRLLQWKGHIALVLFIFPNLKEALDLFGRQTSKFQGPTHELGPHSPKDTSE
jgi:hypothetical protein